MLRPSSAHAEGGVPLWTNRYDGPANGIDSATAIALDSSGNVFVTGNSGTVAYSNSGVPLWTNLSPGFRIATDRSGNVFVTGDSWSGQLYTTSDYATVAYSSAGLPLWTNRYDGPGTGPEQAKGIAVDSSGKVFVTGYSANNPSIPYDEDYTTIAYSNSGVPLWTNRYNGPGNDEDSAFAIAVDPSGDVFVTGRSFSGNDHLTEDYATVAYSSAGDLLWINRYNGPGNGSDWAHAIALDSEGNVFVTGLSDWDYATVAYSQSGVPLWTNRYDGPGISGDDPHAIAVDRSGNVFVTGSSWPHSSGGSSDYATIKYSNAGVPLWTNRYDGPGNSYDAATAIAVDSSGNVFVTGISSNDFATLAYSNAGVPLWTNRYNGLGVVRAIALDRVGNVFVTGQSYNGTNYDYVTIKYSSSVPPPRLDFQRLNNQVVLSWTNAGFSLQSASALPGPFTTSPLRRVLTPMPSLPRINSSD